MSSRYSLRSWGVISTTTSVPFGFKTCGFVDCFLRIFQMVKNQKDESHINTCGSEGK